MSMKILPASVLVFLFVCSSVWASEYHIKEKTPAIQQAFSNRKARFHELRQLKIEGVVGENNRGLLEVRVNTPAAVSAVNAENQDRIIIYQAIVDQNNLGPGGMTQVQQAFADVRRDKAKPGDLIQSSSGEWAKK